MGGKRRAEEGEETEGGTVRERKGMGVSCTFIFESCQLWLGAGVKVSDRIKFSVSAAALKTEFGSVNTH